MESLSAWENCAFNEKDKQSEDDDEAGEKLVKIYVKYKTNKNDFYLFN